MAKRFGVSRVTLRRALGLLQRSGHISRERGRGTIVSPPKIMRQIVPLCSLEQDLRGQGLKLETRVLQYQPSITPPKYISDRLRLAPEETAGFLNLLRLVEDRVICQDWRYLPPPLAACFDPVAVQGTALPDVLRELAGLPISAARWESEITPVPHEVASTLGITPGVLVFVNSFTEYLENGEPANAGVMFYRIDRVKFKFEAHGPILQLSHAGISDHPDSQREDRMSIRRGGSDGSPYSGADPPLAGR